MIQLLATVFKPLWRAFCLDQPAFTPASSPVIQLFTFLNVKLVNLSSRNTGRDYVILIQFFVLFTPINEAAKSMTKQLIIPHVIESAFFYLFRFFFLFFVFFLSFVLWGIDLKSITSFVNRTSSSSLLFMLFK